MHNLSAISCCNNGMHVLPTASKSKDAARHLEGGILLSAPRKQVQFLKSLAPPIMATALVALSPICIDTPASIAQTVDIQKGAQLFRQTCIGCHDAGGNIILPGATLFLKDLQRNGVDTEEEIYQITYFGRGRMPGFGENCKPRGQCTFGARLQDEDIKLLAEFVKLQAEQGWPKIADSEN